MKIKEGFRLREICGEKVVTAEGKAMMNFNKILHLNDSAAYLWAEVLGKDFDEQMLADLLCAHYDVDAERALADAKALVGVLSDAGVLE